MSNSASGNSNVSLPLSRAERLRQYCRRFPGPGGRRLKVRITSKRVNALLKRGYLGPNELDNERAIETRSPRIEPLPGRQVVALSSSG